MQTRSDGLTYVVGEFSFDTPVEPGNLTAVVRSCMWCLEAHRVQLMRLFLAHNRKRAIAVFLAPDAESVRLALRHGDRLTPPEPL